MIITDLKYEYDERNLVTKETNNIEGTITEKTYRYDAEEQLIESIHKTDYDEKKFIYEYDVNGNKTLAKELIDGKVTNRQFSFDKSNKLTEESGEFEVAYKYDNSGNVTQKNHKTTGLIEKFSYNAEDQLVQVENNHGKVITYTYDGFGNRIQKVETTSLQENNFETLTNIAIDDNTFNEDYDVEFAKQITKEKLTDLKTTIEEFTATYDQMCPLVTNEHDKEDSQIVLNYVNDINAAYTEVLQIQSQNYEPLYTYTYGIQRIANDKENDTLLYYQYDAKGSVIGQQKEDSSALHLKISYNDYGKPNRNLNNEYGYNAEAHDYNGTQYLRARYYNTDTGRFNQRDSYRGEQKLPISQNRYTYVWNSPNQYVDKSGMTPLGKEERGKAEFEEKVRQMYVNNRPYASYGWDCYEWIIAQQYKDSFSALGFYAKKIYNQYVNEPPYCGGKVNDPENPYVDEDGNRYSSEDARAEAEERARQEQARKEAEEKQLKDDLDKYGVNYLYLLEGKSLEEKLRILREIKKICDELVENGKWDKNVAQTIIEIRFGEDPNKESFYEKHKNWLIPLMGAIGFALGVAAVIVTSPLWSILAGSAALLFGTIAVSEAFNHKDDISPGSYWGAIGLGSVGYILGSLALASPGNVTNLLNSFLSIGSSALTIDLPSIISAGLGSQTLALTTSTVISVPTIQVGIGALTLLPGLYTFADIYAMIMNSSGGNNFPSNGQIDSMIRKGQAPKSVDRIDYKRLSVNDKMEHIHFKDGSALYKDGTWKHNPRTLTNEELKWLRSIGWNV